MDVADMVRARTLDLLGDAPAATRIVAHRLRVSRPTIGDDGPASGQTP